MTKQKKDQKAEDKPSDFYDWWDALEFKMKILDVQSGSVNKSR